MNIYCSIFLHLIIVCALFSTEIKKAYNLFTTATIEKPSIDTSAFSKPFCIIGNSGWGTSKKVAALRELQTNISRKTADFYQNKELEKNLKLKGSPKYLASNYFKTIGLDKRQTEFAFFAMTLFSEARNLDTKEIEMVARVINNRKGGTTYSETVTELAQFSGWYYKNRHDNAVLLCPGKEHSENWNKVVKIAAEQFEKKDAFLKSKHYFAPNNIPNNKLPQWAKGNLAINFGGHVFLVDSDFKANNEDLDVFYIDDSVKQLRVNNDQLEIVRKI